MNAGEPTAISAEPAEFSRWLVERAFRRVAPFCRGVGAVVVVITLLYDPYAYLNGLWDTSTLHRNLFLAHLFTIVATCTFFYLSGRAHTPEAQAAVLYTFLVTASAIYCAFAVINLIALQDLAIYALGTTFVATVYSLATSFRFWIYALSFCLMTVTIFMVTPEVVSAGIFTNLCAVMAIAYLLDRHMLRQNLALFHEKKKVERERQRADQVLYNVLPESIADELKRDHMVQARKFENLSILFADIVGFTKFSTTVPPDALVLVLNQIFSAFDELVERHELEKIKTIGDAYMVVAYDDAAAIAELALTMLKSIADYNGRNGVEFSIRIGIHIGPAVGGVIGIKRFVYDVWGDAVNTASRMESSGVPGRIHVSEAFKVELQDAFAFEERGVQDIRGKGSMKTYFLLGQLASSPEPDPVDATENG